MIRHPAKKNKEFLKKVLDKMPPLLYTDEAEFGGAENSA